MPADPGDRRGSSRSAGYPQSISAPQTIARVIRVEGALGGLARPFARPPDWPETYENHMKTTKHD